MSANKNLSLLSGCFAAALFSGIASAAPPDVSGLDYLGNEFELSWRGWSQCDPGAGEDSFSDQEIMRFVDVYDSGCGQETQQVELMTLALDIDSFETPRGWEYTFASNLNVTSESGESPPGSWFYDAMSTGIHRFKAELLSGQRVTMHVSDYGRDPDLALPGSSKLKIYRSNGDFFAEAVGVPTFDGAGSLEVPIEIPSGDYIFELIVPTRVGPSTSESPVITSTRVQLDFQPIFGLPPGLSELSGPIGQVTSTITQTTPGLPGSEIITAFDDGVFEDPAWALERLDPELESTMMVELITGLLGRWQGERSTGYHHWAQASAWSNTPFDATQSRLIESKAQVSIALVAEQRMQIRVTFATFLGTDWDERSMEARMFDTESMTEITGTISDHGRVTVFEIPPGSYQMVHIISRQRHIHGQDIEDFLDQFGDEIDVSVRYRIDGDANGDGRVDGADLALILGLWNVIDPEGSLDDNPVTNGSDLARVLGGWSP